ncbi:MAG: efflux RND transporter periplasmic adaptor subunit [Phycisphaerae bacterium]|jgi:RND family efflux transporter MFP subunit
MSTLDTATQQSTTDAPQPVQTRGRGGRWLLGIGGGLIVIAAIAGGGYLMNRDKATAADPTETDARPAVHAIVAPARQMEFQNTLVAQGNVQAKNFAMISPRVAGTLETIMVDEGDTVEAGVTRLFQTDSVRLAKALEVREHEVNVAEQSLREKRASLEKSQADFDKAEYDWNRYQDLYARGVSSQDEYEEAEAEYRRCTALLKLADAQVDLADAQLAQSRSAQAIAEKDLADSLVVAPISGRVTARYQEPGEMGAPGQPVLRIEDPSLLEVSVYLPAQAYGNVEPDQTPMWVTVNGVDLGEHAVSYKSPTIDTTLRTFEARCLLPDPPAAVAAGAMADVRVVLERRQGLGVPRDALQRRSGGEVVFIVENDQARMIPVDVGLETDGMVEVSGEGLTAGAAVVTVGGYFLDPGQPVTVQQETP